MLQRELLYAAMGTGFTCGATILGAAMVFFFKKDISDNVQKVFLGFAAGVMIAASVWSLLIPAMEMAESLGQNVLLPVGGGFALGGISLMLLDQLLPHLHIGSEEPEGLQVNWKRTTMIVLAVTLHNIPEGMAVGLTFAVAAQDPAPGALAGAVALAVGMGLQNFPEGAVISLPLKSETGMKSGKAFTCGMLSGIVEPVAAFITVLLADMITPILPYVLAFAAGSMLYFVVEELIPEANEGDHSNIGTIAFALGFVLMMVLDVALG